MIRLNKLAQILCFSFACAATSQAFAHEGGHGAEIKGLGKHGGKLTAIVAASEADKGEKAIVSGIAEWKLANGAVETFFWKENRTDALEVDPGQAKWIVLFPKPEKPMIIPIDSSASFSTLKLELDQKALDRASLIELILPNIKGKTEKHVFAFAPKSH